jgi:hypothetical protein
MQRTSAAVIQGERFAYTDAVAFLMVDDALHMWPLPEGAGDDIRPV